MKKRVLSLGSCLGVLCLCVPSIASEVDDTNNSFKSTVFESTDTFSTASTSADSLGNFEIESSTNNLFSETGNESEIAQNFGAGTVNNNWYAGGSLGIFFPSNSRLKTGFGAGAYLGYLFNPNLGAEVDVVYAGSDFDGASGDANLFAVIGSARYTAPFTPTSDWNYFGTAGIGFTRSNATGSSSQTDFSFQLKGGAGYAFTENVSGFGQLRYLNVSGDGVTNTLSTELGVHYKF